MSSIKHMVQTYAKKAGNQFYGWHGGMMNFLAVVKWDDLNNMQIYP